MTTRIFGKIEMQDRELRYKRRMSRKSSKRGVSFRITPATEKMFKQLPVEMRLQVLKVATRAGGAVVAKRAASLARPHQSRRTGTAKLQAKKTRDQRANNPKNLSQSIRTKVKVYKNAVLCMVGPERPWGNIGNVFEFGGMIPRWNKGSRDDRTRQRPRPFMRAAVDGTTHQQKKSFIIAVKKRWKQL